MLLKDKIQVSLGEIKLTKAYLFDQKCSKNSNIIKYY